MKKQVKFSNFDYEKNMLPISRKKQFSYLFKSEFTTLLKLGFIVFASFIPYILLSIYQGLTLSSLVEELINSGSSSMEASIQVNPLYCVLTLVKCLSLLIPFVILGGVVRIIKLEVFDEGVLFFKDLGYGIKNNFKVFFISGLIFVLLLSLMEILTSFISLSDIGESISFINGLMTGILFLIICPIFMINLFQGSIYSLSYFKGLANASRVFVKTLFISLLFALLPFGVFLLANVVGFSILWYATIVAILTLLSPIYMLIIHEYYVSRFDILINKKYYPEIYKKGLRKVEE